MAVHKVAVVFLGSGGGLLRRVARKKRSWARVGVDARGHRVNWTTGGVGGERRGRE